VLARLIVVAVEPLNDPALIPVPKVNAFGVRADIVPEAPRATETPLKVTELLASCPLLTVPDRSVVGIVADAVMVEVPALLT
jgi:hypothetical protein